MSFPKSDNAITAKSMRSNRRVDTKPEMTVRHALFRLGYRYRKDFPISVVGRSPRPDIVFARQRLCVFVDGCFWHGCPEHCRIPARNREYWLAKIGGNAARDATDARRLVEAGWDVLRLWEHEGTDRAVDQITSALAKRVATLRSHE